MPLLTIGIPTYNGAPTIGDTIQSIVDQLVGDRLQDDVELLFSDNGSTDNTAEIIEDFRQQHPALRIIYHRNSQNLGYDRNVDMLYQKATGDYVWTFADDDIQCRGAIARVIECLRQHPDTDVVLCNFDFYDPAMTKKVGELTLNNGQDQLCRSATEFLQLSRQRYSSVSSLTMRRQLWLDTPLLEGVGRNFIHAHKLLRALPVSQSFIIAEPLFKARGGSENFEKSGDDMITVPMEFLKLCLSLRDELEPQATRPLIRNSRRYIFRRLRAASRLGFKNRGQLLKDLFRYNYSYPPFWFRMLYLLR